MIKSKLTRFVFDIDGVICKETKPYENAKPIKKIIDFINCLYDDDNYKVILYTARDKKYKQITKEWMKKNNVNHHELVFGKPKGEIYIDDRCISVNSLKRLLKK